VLGRRDEEELPTGAGADKTGGTGITRSGSSAPATHGKASSASRQKWTEGTEINRWLFMLKKYSNKLATDGSSHPVVFE